MNLFLLVVVGCYDVSLSLSRLHSLPAYTREPHLFRGSSPRKKLEIKNLYKHDIRPPSGLYSSMEYCKQSLVVQPARTLRTLNLEQRSQLRIPTSPAMPTSLSASCNAPS
ncbi:hypothetical protein QBC39DRAFT_361121 [Podospora conica]|nr:hypothetical protein QBC39DRAFT_361121 [Schizothecium conicum]